MMVLFTCAGFGGRKQTATSSLPFEFRDLGSFFNTNFYKVPTFSNYKQSIRLRSGFKLQELTGHLHFVSIIPVNGLKIIGWIPSWIK